LFLDRGKPHHEHGALGGKAMMTSFVLRVSTKAQFLIIAAMGVSLAADNPQDPTSKKDLDGLQGTWRLVSAMRDGEALPKDKVKKTTIVIKEDHYQDDTFLFPELAEYATSKEGTIKLDATKKPKQMDATSTAKEVMLGIYELDGDRYKVCFAPTGKPRPSEFASKLGSGNLLQVWKRKEKQ
jgi:uncharacterized protein (TIGR03067 family)